VEAESAIAGSYWLVTAPVLANGPESQAFKRSATFRQVNQEGKTMRPHNKNIRGGIMARSIRMRWVTALAGLGLAVAVPILGGAHAEAGPTGTINQVATPGEYVQVRQAGTAARTVTLAPSGAVFNKGPYGDNYRVLDVANWATADKFRICIMVPPHRRKRREPALI
jgi:hypothetical protein